ncbi:MAG: DUF438 domain-containing protein [Spirochaetia bacterium]|jgi:DUF438 domain-containing protein
MAYVDPRKRQVVADIIRRLHTGLTVEEAKSEILRDVGKLTSAEITEIEQGLIDEGVSPDEIRRFCNVHALLFESALEQTFASPEAPSHPVTLLKRENREIEKVVAALRESAALADAKAVEAGLGRLRGVIGHYALKENALFPSLEKHAFPGPSKVMWSKHNEVREMLKKASNPTQRTPDLMKTLLDEVEGMIFKEESILYPASLERISAPEWVEILKACDQIGFPFLSGAGLHSTLAEAENRNGASVPERTGDIDMPTGSLSVGELTALLDVLPVDITFVDAADEVKYFSQTKDRVFVRATSVLGRKVQNCHPPQSLKKVTEILESFREGSRDHADFWIQLKNQFVSIRYFAVRDPEGHYLGTLEVTQDITGARALTGERRLLSDVK